MFDGVFKERPFESFEPLVRSPKEVSDVERIDPYNFFEMGATISALKFEQGVDVSSSDALLPVVMASWRLDRLLDGHPLEIVVSRTAAESLRDRLNYIADKITGSTSADGSVTDAEWQAVSVSETGYLRGLVEKFEAVFSAEMDMAATYSVPRKGIYSTPALVDEAETAFDDLLRGVIPTKSLGDFHQAGRCMAFNLPTAAGFHACRAIEGLLEVYYQTFTGKEGTLNGWNDYIKALEKVSEGGAQPSPEDKTLASLKQIKDSNRNPLMHPRETLDEPSARVLFLSTELVMIAMANEIYAANEMGHQQGMLVPLTDV